MLCGNLAYGVLNNQPMVKVGPATYPVAFENNSVNRFYINELLIDGWVIVDWVPQNPEELSAQAS